MSLTLGSDSGLLFSCCAISCLDCRILDSAAIDSALFCIANSLLLEFSDRDGFILRSNAAALAEDGDLFGENDIPSLLGVGVGLSLLTLPTHQRPFIK